MCASSVSSMIDQIDPHARSPLARGYPPKAGEPRKNLAPPRANWLRRRRAFAPERIRHAAMPIAIKMPALSPTMEEGTLAKWLVKVGDTVRSGDIMAEIETDKATMEFEAVDEGMIAEIAVRRGHRGREGRHRDRHAGGGGRGSGERARAPAKAEARGRSAERRARTRSSRDCRSARACRSRAAAPAAGSPRPQPGDRVIASPLAKRIAADKGIDLATREGQRPQRPHRQGRRRGRASPAPPRPLRTLQPAAATAAPAPAAARRHPARRAKSSAACARPSRAA